MKSFGLKGEDIAADYLKRKGCRILHRNYRTPIGEADIIMREKDVLVFVEVKTRINERYGQPFEAVDFRKRERLRKVALFYLERNRIEAPVRFDVISILYRDGRSEVKHIKEAF